MSGEKVHCFLGNGECPAECELYEKAAELTAPLGNDFDPYQARLAFFTHDAVNRDVSILDIIGVSAMCKLESKRLVQDIRPGTSNFY